MRALDLCPFAVQDADQALRTAQADHHTFLLSSTSNLAPSDRSTTSTFAISFPRPDTISIVDPPHALTPAILQAARAATGEEAVQDEGWVPGSQQTAAGRKVYKLKVKGFKTWWKPGVSKARYQRCAHRSPLWRSECAS